MDIYGDSCIITTGAGVQAVYPIALTSTGTTRSRRIEMQYDEIMQATMLLCCHFNKNEVKNFKPLSGLSIQNWRNGYIAIHGLQLVYYHKLMKF